MTVSRLGAVKKYLKAILSAQNYIPSSLMSGDGWKVNRNKITYPVLSQDQNHIQL